MRGLVLEGGGAKGAYQVGAIKAFNKKGIKFDGVVGTSIGAINGAFYASNKCDLLYDLWLNTDTKDLFGFESEIIESLENKQFNKENIKKAIDLIIKIIKNKGIDTHLMRDMLSKYINEKELRNSGIDFGLITFNLSDFKPVEIMVKDIPEGKITDYIIASAYLPCFKFERIIDNKFYFDGGIYSNCPVDTFIKKGYDEIYVVKAWEGQKVKYKKKDGVKVTVIGSNDKLGSIMSFSTKTAKRKMNLGYYDTLRILEKLDGNKYYFRRNSENYYSQLFDKSSFNKMKKKYGDLKTINNDKKFIISVIEKVCDEFKIKRFNIYSIPLLLTRLKYKMLKNKNSIYYDFIKEIKIKIL